MLITRGGRLLEYANGIKERLLKEFLLLGLHYQKVQTLTPFSLFIL